MNFPELFNAPPAVCAVGRDYQIMVSVKYPSIMWARVGDQEYYDDSNGVLRSDVATHRITVPCAELDKAEKYTLCFRRMFDRKPYFPESGELETLEIPFRPVKDGKKINFYHLADTHNRIDAPIAAAGFFGDDLDMLVLNGDIPDACYEMEAFALIYKIAGGITKGSIPVVFSRGNHDLRGSHAEKMADNTPSDRGLSYYTFRLGPVWGIVLDCGEDKVDECDAYGHTICCHAFRRRQTEFLHRIIAEKATEYEAPGVKYRLLFSHFHFTEIDKPPHDIEQELYNQWCAILRETIKPHAMFFGHVHENYVTRPGDARDHRNQGVPDVVSGFPDPDDWEKYSGGAISLSPEGISVCFTDQDKNIIGKDFIAIQ